MAIVRVPRKVKQFTYEGVVFGLRMPTTKEQEDITRKMAEYQRSIREQIKNDKADNIFDENTQSGDLAILTELQKYITQMLCVDKETGREIFIGNNSEENIESVPFEFITEAWKCYTNQNERTFKATTLVDLLGQEFVRDYAIIPANVLTLQLQKLDIEDPEKAHKIRIALELPGASEAKKTEPLRDATTT